MTKLLACRLWGARCRKSARRVLSGGTSSRGHAGSVRALWRKPQNNSEAPQRLPASRLVPTRHRVHRERLLARLGQRVKDDRLLQLIRRMLKAKVVLPDGVVVSTEEGVPQGGPLSPLLSNIVLDELDWELARRGPHFVRYAYVDNVYVRS